MIRICRTNSVLNKFKNHILPYLCHQSRFESTVSIDLSKYSPERVRNFSIIAHVDHGKSTLADRLLELTGTISSFDDNKQVLDRLQVERERGITVKAQTASMLYEYKGESYLLNLIDTPGHIDFAYEVSRSLTACQGCLLVIDAVQGIQAQTIANFYLAFEAGLHIIPVINKIDLKNAQTELVIKQIEKTLDFKREDILLISAKNGTNCEIVLEEVVKKIPPPKAKRDNPFKAVVFDSMYENYKGAIVYVACLDGKIQKGDKMVSCYSNKTYEIVEIGVLRPNHVKTNELYAGQVGYIVSTMRSIKEALVGDTIYQDKFKVTALPGFKAPKPMVFSGFFPVSSDMYNSLKSSIEKLCINDSSVSIQSDSSPALGYGFRLGFLGLLHMEVFSERLEKEFAQTVIVTAPNLPYKVRIKNEKLIKQMGTDEIIVYNPCNWPEEDIIKETHEPLVLGSIICPTEYQKEVDQLCLSKRGVFKEEIEISSNRILLKYVLPLNEIIVDFFDKLKSLTSGYASFDYEHLGYEISNLARLTVSLNDVDIEELTQIIHVNRVNQVARRLVEKLKEEVPRELFKIAIQAKVNSKIIARETLPAYRKDVTAKVYGGDRTRKTKLLKQQALGKKHLRAIGNIQLSKDVFINVLKKE